ncbi:hypothetical protein GOV10_02055 [Candidatus Woesearchaeota archaeon]|nr:hypothetical protein [Candidatus Woesearchaeota archaeon]
MKEIEGLEYKTAYAVQTEGDCEGRSTRTLGYATGEPEDIKEFYDGQKMYKIWLNEVKIYSIDSEASGRRKHLEKEISGLEEKLEQLREQIPR